MLFAQYFVDKIQTYTCDTHHGSLLIFLCHFAPLLLMVISYISFNQFATYTIFVFNHFSVVLHFGCYKFFVFVFVLL